MYLLRILVTVLILVPLTFAATTTTVRPTSGNPTTAGKPTTPGKLSKPTPDPLKTILGGNSPANHTEGEIITTNGNPEEQISHCMAFYLCENHPLVVEEVGLFEIRHPCGFCEFPDICCQRESNTQPPIVDPSPSPTPWNRPIETTPEGCGMRKISVDNRSSTPESLAQTSSGEFPWMAMILTSKTASNGTVTENVFVCSATLLSPSIVLTAAHCVANLSPDRLIIRVGEVLYQDRSVHKISVHNEFNHSLLYNDVALIGVTEDFILAPHIAPICLPSISSQFAGPESYDPNNCLATSWGKNPFHEGTNQTTLKRVDLALIEQKQCENRLRETRLGQKFNLNPSFICVEGKPGFDTCQGVGGDPLVCASRENKNKYVQVGILSWGIGCAYNMHGVYASLYANREWLTTEYNVLSVFRPLK